MKRSLPAKSDRSEVEDFRRERSYGQRVAFIASNNHSWQTTLFTDSLFMQFSAALNRRVNVKPGCAKDDRKGNRSGEEEKEKRMNDE